jgi:hypothetical protein
MVYHVFKKKIVVHQPEDWKYPVTRCPEGMFTV